MPPLLSQLCPKCGHPVTEEDHQEGPEHNVDGPALVPGCGQLQLHWQHKVCPR